MGNKNKNAAARGGSRSLLLILMFLIALTACCFSGYLFWSMKYAHAQTDNHSRSEHEAPAVQQVEPLYVSMNTFTVSLTPTQHESDRVLYIGLSVRLGDTSSVQVLEKFLPEYRSRLFMLLSQQTYETLSTDEGKRQLISNIKNELKKPLAFNKKINVTDVLINEFILR
ncbi:flagellar basal body-associated protein FliL [Enterobacter quasihormaechei]|uniref:flagellar basal body-associated protein FliL n=1 Tax=Enterobacter quasihormaechei TaxID=2529382 RepID=UPI002FD76CFB